MAEEGVRDRWARVFFSEEVATSFCQQRDCDEPPIQSPSPTITSALNYPTTQPPLAILSAEQNPAWGLDHRNHSEKMGKVATAGLEPAT